MLCVSYNTMQHRVIFWLSPGTYEHVSMLCKMAEHICYAPAQGALSDDAVWHLSVAYIRPKLRMERPRKTKIGTEIAHVTRYSNTTFKVKRSRSPGHFGWLYWQANMDIELVTDPYACMVLSCRHLQAWVGAYCGGLPPTACFVLWQGLLELFCII